MVNKIRLFFFIFFVLTSGSFSQTVKPVRPIPTKQQLNWHDMEFYLFIHFGPNTFTNLEWGNGTEKETIFHPTALDCRQWAKIARQSGAKGIILTAKHHDGFCLWPSKFSKHTVRESDWKNGKGDVVKELSNACKEYGLKFGIYISPWDRNHPLYGTREYNDVYINTMSELLTNYGSLFELWWDGANGEGPNGKKQVYDFKKFEKVARKLAPGTVIFSDIGPDIRWVGNEKGIAGKTNWNLLDTSGFKRGEGAPPQDTLNTGNENGKHWIPAECDVSIRPGWFFHESENEKVKSPQELFDLYLKSVGRGANFLLNVPPDQRGLIHSNDSAALAGFKKLVEDNFKLNLLKKAAVLNMEQGQRKKTDRLTDNNRNTYELINNDKNASILIDLNEESPINCIVLAEPIQLGQRVKKFSIILFRDSKTIKEINETTIGRKRIITFPTEKVRTIEIKIQESKAIPLLSEIGAYHIQEELVEE